MALTAVSLALANRRTQATPLHSSFGSQRSLCICGSITWPLTDLYGVSPWLQWPLLLAVDVNTFLVLIVPQSVKTTSGRYTSSCNNSSTYEIWITVRLSHLRLHSAWTDTNNIANTTLGFRVLQTKTSAAAQSIQVSEAITMHSETQQSRPIAHYPLRWQTKNKPSKFPIWNKKKRMENYQPVTTHDNKAVVYRKPVYSLLLYTISYTKTTTFKAHAHLSCREYLSTFRSKRQPINGCRTIF